MDILTYNHEMGMAIGVFLAIRCLLKYEFNWIDVGLFLMATVLLFI